MVICLISLITTTSILLLGMTQNNREEIGKQIAQKPDQIKRIDDNWYQVKAVSEIRFMV